MTSAIGSDCALNPMLMKSEDGNLPDKKENITKEFGSITFDIANKRFSSSGTVYPIQIKKQIHMGNETSTDSLTSEQLKFPIGPFVKKEKYTADEIHQFINDIEAAPISFRTLTEGLSETEWAKTYREGSWNIRQLVHHVADIQMLHFLRMKKALTEPGKNETTLILMDEWAKTADGKEAPVKDSLLMLDGITKRYVYLMRTLTPQQFEISYYHAARKYDITQAQAIAMSAWHLKHHRAHIQLALDGNLHS